MSVGSTGLRSGDILIGTHKGTKGVMITSVYPSNNATREQLRGRINRVVQKTEPLLYYTTHIGILTNIMENHNSAKSLSAALQEVAEKV